MEHKGYFRTAVFYFGVGLCAAVVIDLGKARATSCDGPEEEVREFEIRTIEAVTPGGDVEAEQGKWTSTATLHRAEPEDVGNLTLELRAYLQPILFEQG